MRYKIRKKAGLIMLWKLNTQDNVNIFQTTLSLSTRYPTHPKLVNFVTLSLFMLPSQATYLLVNPWTRLCVPLSSSIFKWTTTKMILDIFTKETGIRET